MGTAPDTDTAPDSLRIDLISADAAGDTRLARLLDATFPVPEGSHFFDDFPIWSSAHAAKLLGAGRMARLGVFDGAELAGSACVRLASLKLGAQRLPIALIGAVATLREHQGHGFASRLAAIATRWAQERGAAFAVLWGSEHALYRRLGFELCGQQLRAKLAGLTLPEVPPGAEGAGVNRGWIPALHELLRKREGGLVLDEDDRDWMQAHRHTRWYWTGDPAAPSAFAALGRGIDLRGMVHEWGGARAELARILATIRREEPAAELLGPAWHFQRYGVPAALATSEFLCLAKVLDLPAMLACFPGGRAPSPEGAGLAALLGPPSEAAPFPLPLWLWGLDAV